MSVRNTVSLKPVIAFKMPLQEVVKRILMKYFAAQYFQGAALWELNDMNPGLHRKCQRDYGTSASWIRVEGIAVHRLSFH